LEFQYSYGAILSLQNLKNRTNPKSEQNQPEVGQNHIRHDISYENHIFFKPKQKQNMPKIPYQCQTNVRPQCNQNQWVYTSAIRWYTWLLFYLITMPKWVTNLNSTENNNL